MAHAALQFLFWRVFMRISYNCPPHLKFALDIKRWSQLYDWSKESIMWLDKNDDALDTLFVFAYTATNCALIQVSFGQADMELTRSTIRGLDGEIRMRWRC